MFVPGHNENLLASAAKSDADVLLLDLEDSVQPPSNKSIARETIVKWLSSGQLDRFQIYPRVNDRESGHLLKDVQTLAIEGVDGFMYPKSRTGEDVYFFDKLLETVEYEKQIPIGTFKIIPLIETAGAVLNAANICQASSRVVAIAFGCEDFVSDLEGIHDQRGLSLYAPRALIALAARANNVIPIDTVHINVHDLNHLEENLTLAKSLGFEGMLVLHPKELPLVHQFFSPTQQEYEEALRMLILYEETQQEGKGVAVKDGTFIGPPMAIAANKVVSRMKRIQRRNS